MAGGDLETLGCAVLDTSGLDDPFVGIGSTSCLKEHGTHLLLVSCEDNICMDEGKLLCD